MRSWLIGGYANFLFTGNVSVELEHQDPIKAARGKVVIHLVSPDWPDGLDGCSWKSPLADAENMFINNAPEVPLSRRERQNIQALALHDRLAHDRLFLLKAQRHEQT